jgi:DNA primase
MMRSLDKLIEEDMNVRVAALSEGHDPDSFIRQFGVDNFRNNIDRAQSLFDYKLNILKERYDTASIEGKALVSGEMLQTVEKISNAVVQAEYIKRLSQELAVPEQALIVELKKVRQMTGEKKTYGKINAPHTPVREQLRVVESDILRLLLEEQSFIETTKREIAPSDFKDDQIREVISKIYELFEHGQEINAANLINSFEDQAMQQMIARIMAKENVFIGDTTRIHRDYIHLMKKDRLKWQMQGLQKEISDMEKQGNFSKLDTLLKEYNQLAKEAIL